MINVKSGVILLTRSEPPCPGCKVAKKILSDLAKRNSNFEFRVIDISENSSGIPYTMSVPTLLIKGTPIHPKGLRLDKKYIKEELNKRGYMIQ